MENNQTRPSPEMLAFSYKINKIIRDMLHVQLPDETAELKRELIVEALKEVSQRLESEFS